MRPSNNAFSLLETSFNLVEIPRNPMKTGKIWFLSDTIIATNRYLQLVKETCGSQVLEHKDK